MTARDYFKLKSKDKAMLRAFWMAERLKLVPKRTWLNYYNDMIKEDKND